MLSLGGFMVVTWFALTPRTRRGEQPEQDEKLAAWCGRYLRSAGVLLVLVLISVFAIDWLAAGVIGGVNSHRDGWWGDRQESYWSHVVSADWGLLLTSRDLEININGDSLTARYTATAPAWTDLAARGAASEDGNSGDDLVANVLGTVNVAEFRYGFTGTQHTLTPLTFRVPQVSVTGRQVRITVTSDPFRLYFARQYISVDKPSDALVSGPDLVHVKAASVQVMDVSGAKALDDTMKKGAIVAANLRRDGTMSAAVSERGAGHGWLDGLRGIGGITIPVADPLLGRLGGLIVYLVLFWALDRAVAVRDWNPEVAGVVVVARKAVLTIVAALAFVAFTGFAFDLSTALWRDPDGQGYVAAGPLGLLVGGAALAWPLACSRVGPVSTQCNAREPLAGKARLGAAVPFVLFAAVACVYWFVLHWLLDINPVGNVHVLAGTVAVTVLIPVLLRWLIGRWRAVTWLASAAMVAVALAATIAWPLLWYGGFFTSPLSLQVNAKGKWIYLTVAVLAVAGLCIMSWRVVRALMGQYCWWRPAVPAIVSVVIAAAVLPDAVVKAQLANSHAPGSVPSDLFGLFDASPQLLDWLLLGLAITVVVLLSAAPDLQPARRIALPIALMLLYWNDTWLYLPVTMLIGLLLLTWQVLPRELAEAHPRTPEETLSNTKAALRRAVARWRGADFVAGQRQTLAAGSADALRELLDKHDQEHYRRGAKALADTQEKMAKEHDSRQRAARAAKARAFSHAGDMPDRQAGWHGAIAGAVLGIIPAAVTVITSQPPSGGSGYPVLDFLGGTAWNLFSWMALGWFIGYFLPLIRGGNGTEKALWLFLASLAALPNSVIWDNRHDWALDTAGYVQLFVFLIVTTVIVCDLRTLKKADMGPADWVRVQNWRFIVTWSTALVAAISTAAVAFLSTVAADFTNQAFTNSTSQQQGPSGKNGG
jgi:hypothetical protein